MIYFIQLLIKKKIHVCTSVYLTFIQYLKYQQINSNDAVLLNWSDNNVCPV